MLSLSLLYYTPCFRTCFGVQNKFGNRALIQYPDYWLNLACLILGYMADNKILHVVVGLDDYVHIVTAYFPSTEKFESDMKTRKGL